MSRALSGIDYLTRLSDLASAEEQRQLSALKRQQIQGEARQLQQSQRLIDDYLQSPNQQTLSRIAYRDPAAAKSIMDSNKMYLQGQARKVRSMYNTWQTAPISQKKDLYRKWREENQEDMAEYPLEYNEQTAPNVEFLFNQDNRSAMGVLEEEPMSPEGRLEFDIRRGFLEPGAIPRTAEDVQKGEERRFKQSMDLRKEFTKNSQQFVTQRDSYNRILASAEDPSPAGDLALIFNYMKVLDPGSTVREGEFATAQNSAGIPERVRAQYNKIISGERLSDKTRTDFVGRSGKLFNKALQTQKRRVKQFEGIARRAKLLPEDVILDLTEGIEISSAPPSGDEGKGPGGISPSQAMEELRRRGVIR